ncbi:MAG: hypothetical protein HY698_15040 [Deltaproteobacteria bacterium]|nr:hypothetical protein [Deltaproteobacteria bacterium]
MKINELIAFCTIVGILGCPACKGDPPPAALILSTPREGLSDADRSRLESPPLAELSLVPASAEALVRVDLLALGAVSPDSAKTLDFLLRAQQPAAWEVMTAAGLVPGKELTALYLVVLPGLSGRSGESGFLVGGVGSFDATRVQGALRRAGGIPEPAGSGVMFSWRGELAPGASSHAGPEIGETRVGVASGVVVFGSPHHVRHALEAHARRVKDVRASPLTREILLIDQKAVAWGVARGGRDDSDSAAPRYLENLVPGLKWARFLARPPATSQGGPLGSVELTVEFNDFAKAQGFREKLLSLLAEASNMAAGMPVGTALARVRDRAKVSVEKVKSGHVLTVASPL